MSRNTAALTLAEAVEVTVTEARRHGADRFDLMAVATDRLGLDFFGGTVAKTEVSNTRGLGLRVFRGRRHGSAFTERLTVEALRNTVGAASAHAELAGDLDVDLDLPQPVAAPAVDLQLDNPALDSLSLECMKSFALRLEAAAFEADARVENVPFLSVARDRRSSIVCNSNQVLHASSQGSVVATVGAVAMNRDTRKLGIYTRGGRSFDPDPEPLARTAVERAVELLGAAPLASGRYPVVLSHRISPRLFAMFAAPFFGDAVLEGRSRLRGQVERPIAAPALTITSDPLIPSAPGSCLFDAEGVPARTVEVVREGVLRTCLHTLESAKRAGTEPTGTGARDDSGRIAPSFANYVVRKGSHTLDELLAAYPRLLYLVQMEGAAACSPVSGEISIGVQGFLCEHGQRIRPVERVTLSTNFFDLLHGIRGLSDRYSDAFSSCRVPDLLVEDVHISG